MLSTALAPEPMIVRSLTGVRQRVILIMLASVLALATQSTRGGLPPTGADGDLDIAVEIGGEQLPFACRGIGHTTVLFLVSDGTMSLPVRDEAREGAAAITRVCTLDMAGVDTGATWLTPSQAEQIAADLDGVLAGEQVPAPYVLVATEDLEPVTARFAERSGGLVNGTLLIDPESQPVTGWVIGDEGMRRQIILESIEQVLLAIRSLVWPPAKMHTP